MTENLSKDQPASSQPPQGALDSNLRIEDTTSGAISAPSISNNNNYTAINQIIQEQNLNEEEGDDDEKYYGPDDQQEPHDEGDYNDGFKQQQMQ